MTSIGPSSAQTTSLSSSVSGKVPLPFPQPSSSDVVHLVLDDDPSGFAAYDGEVSSSGSSGPQMNSLEDVLNLTGISDSMFMSSGPPPTTSSSQTANLFSGHLTTSTVSSTSTEPSTNPNSNSTGLLIPTSNSTGLLIPTSNSTWPSLPTPVSNSTGPHLPIPIPNSTRPSIPTAVSKSTGPRLPTPISTPLSFTGSSSTSTPSVSGLPQKQFSLTSHRTAPPNLMDVSSDLARQYNGSLGHTLIPSLIGTSYASSLPQSTLSNPMTSLGKVPSTAAQPLLVSGISSVRTSTQNPPNKPPVTSWRWSSSPLQGSLGKRRPSSSSEEPNKKVTTKGPDNSAEAVDYNIKQSLILDLHRTQLAIKHCEATQQQLYRQGKLKEAKDEEQRIALLIQRQKQIVQAVQSPVWESLGRNKVSTTSSSLSSSTSLNLSTSNSFLSSAHAPHSVASTSTQSLSPLSTTTLSANSGGGSSLSYGTSLMQHGVPGGPAPFTFTGTLTHSTTSGTRLTNPLTQTTAPGRPTRPLTLTTIPGGPTALNTPLTQTTSRSSLSSVNAQNKLISSPSFVAVSSGLPGLAQPPILTSTVTSTFTSTLTSTLTSTVTSTSPLPTLNTSLVFSKPENSTSTVSTVTQHGSVSLSSSLPQPSVAVAAAVLQKQQLSSDKPKTDVSSESTITAQEALILLNNPALQDKLPMEKLQRLNSIRLQALQDYQKWQIQVFLTQLPPHQTPTTITELKKIILEKKLEIQVPVYLAPRAIPRLYAQELMQKISSVTSGPFTTSSSSSIPTVQPIPSLLGQSAGTTNLMQDNRSGLSFGGVVSSGPASSSSHQQVSSSMALHHPHRQQQQQQQQQQQKQQHVGGKPWSDVQHRLKGIIANMEQQQSQSLASMYGGRLSHQFEQKGAGSSSAVVTGGSSSSGAYMTRAQSRARQLAEIRAQQMKRKTQTSEEAYISTHMKAMLTKDHSNLFDSRPFSSINDAVERLLSYHVFYEENDSPDDERKFNLLHKYVCSLLVTRQTGLMARYHKMMLEESQREVSKGLEVSSLTEFVNLITPPPPPSPPAPLSPPTQPAPSTLSPALLPSSSEQPFSSGSWLSQPMLSSSTQLPQSSAYGMSSWPPLSLPGYTNPSLNDLGNF